MRYLIIFACSFLSLAASSQIGYLDKAYATNGKTLTPLPYHANLLGTKQIENDKMLVLARSYKSSVADDHYLIRYNNKGFVDGSFGNGGKSRIVDTAVNSILGVANTVCFDLFSDGKICVMQSIMDKINSQFYFSTRLLRYNTDGTLDETFGDNGIVNHKFFAKQYSSYKMYVSSNDDIIIVGGDYADPSALSIYIAKLNKNGDIVSSFGNSGIAKTNYPTKDNLGGTAFDSNDNLYLSLFSDYYPDNSTTVVLKFNPQGVLDNNFGTDGIANISQFELSENSVYIGRDSSIYVTGYHYGPNNIFNGNLIKLKPNGEPDAEFGTSGEAECPFPTATYSNMQAIVEMETGEIALTGRTRTSNTYRPSLTKIRADGTSDATFNFDGFIDINFNQNENSNMNLAQYNASTGTVILIGTSGDNIALAGVKMHYGASIEAIEKQQLFYPNPAKNQVNIDPLFNFNEGRIINTLGETVLSFTENNIDIAHLASGVYTLVLNNEGFSYSNRMIVQ